MSKGRINTPLVMCLVMIWARCQVSIDWVVASLAPCVPCHDLGTMSSEHGLGCCFLSGALHRCLGVVKNVQGASHINK
jgi:hypothetical protein